MKTRQCINSIAAGFVLIGLQFCISVVAAETIEPRNPLRLWYRQPAVKWTEALPVGCGKLGAMVFGGTVDERIQFNEDTLWTGKPHDYVHAGAAGHLDEIRKLIDTGADAKVVEDLIRSQFLSLPIRQKSFQPFGDIYMHFGGHDKVEKYERELNLSEGISRVRYQVGDLRYLRETFASYPDQVIVVRISCDKPGNISCDIKLNSPHKYSQTTFESENAQLGYLKLTGQVQDLYYYLWRQILFSSKPLNPLDSDNHQTDGLKFEARLKIVPTNGKMSCVDNLVSVQNADSLVLILAAGTSFKSFQDVTGVPEKRVQSVLAGVAGKAVDQIRKDHIADHQNLFGRMQLDLGTNESATLPTDERLKKIKTDGLASDPALAALEFQYGRYLLIASSRAGSEPATLQGRWNDLLDPPWESKYTTNINLEMNYWPAEVANLSECTVPLFDMIDGLRVTGHRVAKEHYNARGWVLHHNTDIWRAASPINNIDGQWPTGGAWLCWHLWEHYQFTGDKQFLAQRAWPAMKECSMFFLDFLVKDEKTGWLISTPSHSPEQGGSVAGPSMDHQLIRSVFDNTLEAASILGIDDPTITQIKNARKNLAPDQIGKHGQLQEWLTDIDKPNNKHRHMSPLWCLYPGTQYTMLDPDPKMFNAAKLLLQWRGDGSTGWSFAWRMPLWARAGDGEIAFKQLDGMMMRRTLPNMFDLCGPFQIDGNFGVAAGIAECLLQSHVRLGVDKIPVIQLLPALPSAWPTGHVSGLCARGGFEIDMTWDRGKLTSATVHSKIGSSCEIRLGNEKIQLLNTVADGEYLLNGDLKSMQLVPVK